jgi:hypothetical protein
MQRIKHIASGLYYRPSYHKAVKIKNHNGDNVAVYVKSNLSKNGKIYRAATLAWLHQGYYNHIMAGEAARKKLEGSDFYYYHDREFPLDFDEKEWIVEDV